jgi:cytochrome b subunit of formate dehydrogenase
MLKLRTVTTLLVLAAFALAGDDDNETCLECHSDADVMEGKGLVDAEAYKASVHANQSCIDCHYELEDAEYPHATGLEKVDCGECHEEAAAALAASVHGQTKGGESRLPVSCTACHGVHDILASSNRNARLYPLNVYKVCGQCHLSVDVATASADELLHDPYTDDAHAIGILRHGLAVSATCVSCHGGHDIRHQGDPESRVARQNVDKVCGTCHIGPVEQYRQSIHHLKGNGEGHKGATCSDCHLHHAITSPDADFKAQTINACSNCHAQRGGSFRLNYHGRRVTLGFQGDVATCEDCHGAHKILPIAHPESRLHPDNKVETCAACHPASHEEFTNFLVHADYTDKERNPRLYLIYSFMTWLLIITLILGCLHAVLWLVRSLAAGEWRRPKLPKGMRFVRRWPRMYVFYHIMLMTCVLILAGTGFPLHYADQPWANDLMNSFGGASAAGYVHRVVAVIMMALFFFYIFHVAYRVVVQREKGIFFGPNTMLPRIKDLQDLMGNIRWFLFRGERPRYDRWTYWEKFDFWAVFWGMFVIGLSGLMLWFPEQATRFVPGWFLNAAVIIHGIEALLDIAFIFTVHIFHANLRPDKFPMDTMFLSGRISEKEFAHERPEEYDRAVREQMVEKMLARTPPRGIRILAYVIGSAALLVGFFFVIAMIIALTSN